MGWDDIIVFALGNITGVASLIIFAGMVMTDKTDNREVKRPVGFRNQ